VPAGLISTLVQTTDSPPTTSGASTDLVSEVGSDIKVAIDRWSAGHLGLTDIAAALVVLVVAAAAAYVVRRVVGRWSGLWEGAAGTAAALVGQLLSVAIYIFAAVMILEILGFSIGPVIIIVLVVVLIALFLRPLLQNLSPGLVLQLRGPFSPGDVVETNGVVGVVEEVNTRTVVLITSDGRTAHVPNADVLAAPLYNLSAVGRRRTTISVRLPEGSKLEPMLTRLRDAVSAVGPVLDDPPPEVMVTGFLGAQCCVDVLFWHSPELWAERLARDRVGHALVQLIEDGGLALADLSVTIRPPGDLDPTAGADDG